MPKLPRDITGKQLAKVLGKFGYSVSRQTGSHIRLTTQSGGEHHITIPQHDPVKVGLLAAILDEVAKHVKQTRSEVIQRLFG